MTEGREIERRRDIDGLRALAIALVVAYHTAPGWVPGGFIGVDVFFVLSGYLITQILTSDTAPGRFRRFYARRVRRLAPALVVVLATTLALGQVVLLDDQLRQLAHHTLAATLFVANFAFWLESGYFDSAAIEKPLLHLWSLGIEEQFYLVWPFVVWWLLRRFRSRFQVTLGLALLSFGATVVWVSRAPDATFYLPWFRVWELLAGACLALARTPTTPSRAIVRDTAAWLGAVAILASAWRITPTVPFPSWSALGPVLGTVLLVWAGPGTWLARTVWSRQPVVALGLVSYPLYLWHWPLLSLQYQVDPGVGPAQRAGAVLAALVLSAATYRLAELPTRSAFARWPRRTVSVLCAALLVVAATAVALRSRPTTQATDTSPIVVLLQNQADLDTTLRAEIPTRACLGSRFDGDPLAARLVGPLRRHCSASGPEGTSPILLWGDSTANSWAPLIHEIAKRRGVEAVVLSVSGCPPLLGIRSPWHNDCDLVDSEWKLAFAERLKPSLIVITARWGAYATEPPPGYRGEHHLITTSPRGTPNLDSSREALASQLPATLEQLLRIAPVVAIGAIPDLPASPLRTLHMGAQAQPNRTRHLDEQDLVLSTLAEVARHDSRLSILDPTDQLCAGDLCAAIVDGVLYYTDSSHISAQGALSFIDELSALPSK